MKKISLLLSAAVFALTALFAGCDLDNLFGDDDDSGKNISTPVEKIYVYFDEENISCTFGIFDTKVSNGDAIEEGEYVTFEDKNVKTYPIEEGSYRIKNWTVNGTDKSEDTYLVYDNLKTSDAVKENGKYVLRVSDKTRKIIAATLNFDETAISCKSNNIEKKSGDKILEGQEVYFFAKNCTGKYIESYAIDGIGQTLTDNLSSHGYFYSKVSTDTVNVTDLDNGVAELKFSFTMRDALSAVLVFDSSKVTSKIEVYPYQTASASYRTIDTEATVYEGEGIYFTDAGGTSLTKKISVNGTELSGRGFPLKKNPKTGELCASYLTSSDGKSTVNYVPVSQDGKFTVTVSE